MESRRDKWLNGLAVRKDLSDDQIKAALKVYVEFTEDRRKAFSKMIAK